MSFFDRTRARYLELAQCDSSVVVINAEQTIELVAQDIKQALRSWLAQ